MQEAVEFTYDFTLTVPLSDEFISLFMRINLKLVGVVRPHALIFCDTPGICDGIEMVGFPSLIKLAKIRA